MITLRGIGMFLFIMVVSPAVSLGAMVAAAYIINR